MPGSTSRGATSRRCKAGLQQQAGGRKALEQGWLQQYSVAPSRLDDSLRTEIEAQKLAKALGVDMNAPEGQAVFWKELSKASKKLDMDLNPRYGTWDVEKSKRDGLEDAVGARGVRGRRGGPQQGVRTAGGEPSAAWVTFDG